jgi:hypothetical protein
LFASIGQIRDFAVSGIKEFEGEPYENPQNAKCQNSFEDGCRVMALGYIEGGARRKRS